MQIDANGDNIIYWSELCTYIMVKLNSQTGCFSNDNKQMIIKHMGPDAATVRKNDGYATIINCLYLGQLECLVTLSESTFTLWDKTLNRVFRDNY